MAVCWNTAGFREKCGQKVQPPLRGCVLKPLLGNMSYYPRDATASARLCVETALSTEQYNRTQAEKQREDEIKKINSNFKYEIK